MFFILSEGRRSAARTKPAHYNSKIRRARNDVSIFLALLSCPEGGESLVREDVENNGSVLCVCCVMKENVFRNVYVCITIDRSLPLIVEENVKGRTAFVDNSHLFFFSFCTHCLFLNNSCCCSLTLLSGTLSGIFFFFSFLPYFVTEPFVVVCHTSFWRTGKKMLLFSNAHISFSTPHPMHFGSFRLICPLS